jgi:hypothetical protein
MLRRLLALACVAALALPLAGCFVLDEIDKGSKIMDDHSAGAGKRKKEAAESEVAAPVGKKDAVDAYFRAEEEDGTTKSFAPGEESEGIGTCRLGGQEQFMKREECAARGGQAG